MTVATVYRVLRWIAAACIALVVAVYVAVWFVNRHDQPPSAAFVRLMALPASLPSVAEKDNGFVFYMGLSAEKGVDPRVEGAQRIAWARGQLLQPNGAVALQFPGKKFDARATRSANINAVFEHCQNVGLDCASKLTLNDTELKGMLENEAWLLDRYLEMQTYAEWRETLAFDPRLPMLPVVASVEAQRLLFLKAWIRAERGDAEGVQSLLQSDIVFWRRNLAVDSNVISKMLSGSAIRRHFAWANLILRRLAADKVALAIPAAWRLPVSDAERAMLRAFGGEAQFQINMFRQMNKPSASASKDVDFVTWLGDRLGLSTFQLQDTCNQSAEAMTRIADTLAVDYDKLAGVMARERKKSPLFVLKHGLYNVVGNILLGVGSSSWMEYGARIADLEGIRRATLMVAEARSNGAAPESMAEMALTSSMRNPYDGKPFTWNAATQSIEFAGLDQRASGRVLIPY